MNASQLPPRWLLVLLIVLFFGSGACALVYQVMWLRLLSLVFGVTVYAASTVLAAFMAGLGAGSYLTGRLGVRITRPLAAFGIAEILVGITAFLTPALLESLTGVWVSMHDWLPRSMTALTVIRFIVAFVVLIVPTSLMGATLPLIVKSAITRNEHIGGKIGLLYAINTTGAIVGALTAGFYFIAEIGVAQSFQIAAAANIAIGLAAWTASIAVPAAPAPAPRELQAPTSAPYAPEAPEAPERPRAPSASSIVLWVFFLSGVMSLALEIIWFRMLVLFLRPTAYAFTIMLACVLAGIALGSLIVAPLLRRQRDWLPTLAVIQAVIGFAAVLSFNALTPSQLVIEAAAPLVTQLGFNPYLAPLAASSVIAMLPTTILLGVAFPIGLTLWAGDGSRDDTTRVGVFYSINVAGAIIGSIVAGFVLLPSLGSRRGLMVAAGLATASSILLALTLRRTQPRAAMAIASGAAALYLAGAGLAIDPFDVAFERFHRRESLLWREEGAQTTVAVHERPGNPAMRVMYLDGNHQANDSPSTAFVHHRIGALPVMLHERPRTALVVGLGGGATPGAVARMNVDVDVVELSPAVVAASNYFKNINFDLLSRPNVRLHVDDGRNFLLMNRRKYDVITADIMLPRHAGAGALYSREYFELVRRSLSDGGLVMQWNGADSATEYKLLLRTFLSVFPHTTLWADGGLMLGSVRPFAISRTNYGVRRQTFDQFPWDLATLKRIYTAGPEEARAFAGAGPLLSDDRPVIEYFLSLPKNDGPGGYTGPIAPIENVITP